MRRMGWFVVGVATVAGAAAAVPMVRARLRASDEDGFEPLDTGPDTEALSVEEIDVDADVVEARPRKPRQPHTDQQADALREQITESRARLRQKAKAATAPAAEQADEGDSEDPPEAS